MSRTDQLRVHDYLNHILEAIERINRYFASLNVAPGLPGLHKNFEDYAHQIDGEELWFARNLQGLLGYAKWGNFAKVVDKAKVYALAKSRLTGENRCPEIMKLPEITGFRPSPE
jgi:hypothetical protein